MSWELYGMVYLYFWSVGKRYTFVNGQKPRMVLPYVRVYSTEDMGTQHTGNISTAVWEQLFPDKYRVVRVSMTKSKRKSLLIAITK